MSKREESEGRPPNRAQFQVLADVRIRESLALLSSEHWAGAYYLAGYSIECALKACIARKTRQFDFPDRDFANQVWTHKLASLLKSAGLEEELTRETVDLQANWAVVKDWREDRRYAVSGELDARSLVTAIVDPANGVLPWLKSHW